MADFAHSSVYARARWRLLTVLFFLLAGLLLARPCAADAKDDFFKAAKLDNRSAVQSLLKQGINPNLTESERGESALILAARENAMQVFALLLEARDINLDLRAKNGDTALMIAAYKKNRVAVEMLLAKGAKVNQDGWTALHYAAAVGETDIVTLLINKSAELDAPSPNLTTPLMMAARSGNIYTVKVILDAGADINLVNEQGLRAIDFAKKSGHTQIVEGLQYRQKLSERRATEAVAAEEKRMRPISIDRRLPPMN